MTGELQTTETKAVAHRPFRDRLNELLDYLSSLYGLKVMDGETRQVFMVRIADYNKRHGLKWADVKEAFRRLASPKVQGRVKFGTDLLAEFAKVIPLVIRDRREAEENAKRDAEAEAAKAWKESEEGQRAWAAFRERLHGVGTPIGPGKETVLSSQRRGVQRGVYETTQQGQGNEEGGGKEAARDEGQGRQGDGKDAGGEARTGRGSVRIRRRKAEVQAEAGAGI